MKPGWYRSKDNPHVALYHDGTAFTGEERPIKPKATRLSGPRSRSAQFAEQAALIDANNTARTETVVSPEPTPPPPTEPPPDEPDAGVDAPKSGPTGTVPEPLTDVMHSSDGQSYWNGSDWVPTSGQQPTVTPESNESTNSAAASASMLAPSFVPFINPMDTPPTTPVIAESPEPVQYSPDGNYYWDGNQWVLRTRQAPAQTPVEPYVPPQFDITGNMIEWSEVDESDMQRVSRRSRRGARRQSPRKPLSSRTMNALWITGGALMLIPISFAIYDTTSKKTPSDSTDYTVSTPIPSPSETDPLLDTPEGQELRKSQGSRAAALSSLRADLAATVDALDKAQSANGQYPPATLAPSLITPSYGNIMYVMYLTKQGESQSAPTAKTKGYILCASNPATGTGFMYWSGEGFMTGRGLLREENVNVCEETFTPDATPMKEKSHVWSPGEAAVVVVSPDGGTEPAASPSPTP